MFLGTGSHSLLTDLDETGSNFTEKIFWGFPPWWPQAVLPWAPVQIVYLLVLILPPHEHLWSRAVHSLHKKGRPVTLVRWKKSLLWFGTLHCGVQYAVNIDKPVKQLLYSSWCTWHIMIWPVCTIWKEKKTVLIFCIFHVQAVCPVPIWEVGQSRRGAHHQSLLAASSHVT